MCDIIPNSRHPFSPCLCAGLASSLLLGQHSWFQQVPVNLQSPFWGNYRKLLDWFFLKWVWQPACKYFSSSSRPKLIQCVCRHGEKCSLCHQSLFFKGLWSSPVWSLVYFNGSFELLCLLQGRHSKNGAGLVILSFSLQYLECFWVGCSPNLQKSIPHLIFLIYLA